MLQKVPSRREKGGGGEGGREKQGGKEEKGMLGVEVSGIHLF